MDVVLLVTMGTVITAITFLAITGLLGITYAKMRYYKSMITGEEYVEEDKPSIAEKFGPIVSTASAEGGKFLAMTFETIWKTCVVVCTAIFVLASTGILLTIMYQIAQVEGWLP